MQASPIRKLVPLANRARAKGISVFHLNIGQPDILTPPEYWKSMGENLPEVLAYGPSQGLDVLRDAISNYYRRAGIDVGRDDILITTGGSEAVFFAFMIACDPGDEVICFEPFYTNYNGFAAMAGVKLVPVTSSVEAGFHLPPEEDIQAKVTERTRAILICTPTTPPELCFPGMNWMCFPRLSAGTTFTCFPTRSTEISSSTGAHTPPPLRCPR